MMRATDDYHFYRLCRALSDEQWQKIRASLRAVGVDAHTIIGSVVVPSDRPEFCPDKFDSRRVSKKPRRYSRSLRETLPDIAYECCTRTDSPKVTPKQMAAELTRIVKSCNTLLTQCEALLDRLDHEQRDRDRLWDIVSPYVSPMTDRLKTSIAELERWRDELPAMGTKGNHVSTAHNLFWQELARIFDAHVGNDVKSRNQHKIRFLRACSEPFFPKVITDDDGPISAFVERRSPRSAAST